VEVPLTVCRKSFDIWPILFHLVPLFNFEAKSDFMVGIKCLETGIYGAHLNVLTNLKSFDKNMESQVSCFLIEESTFYSFKK
jgi:glutamate formiminotransferase / formiminotetrahydrofolate cyclodeaminase